MNKDKVYLKGYVIGRAADTLGYEGLMVQLENLDVVEIDKSLVHKKIDEPQLIKLKDVIARIKSLDVGTQEVWLNKILKELGSDYRALIYKDGYEQGKLEGLIEREIVTVPRFVADYIKYAKESDWDLIDAMKGVSYEDYDDLMKWFYKDNNQEIFAQAWIFGYEVEKEKQYTVKMKGVDSCFECLYYGMGSNTWSFRMKHESGYFRRSHTRKELEEAGFGWVFDCKGIEVKEVKE